MQSVKKGILLCCFLLTCTRYIEARDTWKKKKYALITVFVGVCGGILYQIQKSAEDKKAERLAEINDEIAEIEKNIKLLDSSPASHILFSRWESRALSGFGIEDEKSTGGLALHTTDDAEETMHRGRLGSLGVDMENRGGIYDSLVQFDPASWVEQLQEGLNNALPHIRRAKGKDCVILIGSTGVGKSTLINALYNGVEHMEEVEVIREGVFGECSHTYLVPKQAIKDEQGNILFRVESGIKSSIQSTTTHVTIAEQGGIAFCECPDTQGGIFDIVYGITLGELFMNARSVQICYLMTEGNVMNSAGIGDKIKKIIQTVCTIFKDKPRGGLITYDNLRKLKFIITKPTGRNKKNSVQRILRGILAEAFENIDKRNITRLLIENLFFVDAKDRPSKFVPGKSMDKVADLKQKLVDLDENMVYDPKVLTAPVSPKAQETIQEQVLEFIKSRTLNMSIEKSMFNTNTEILAALEDKLDQIKKEILTPLSLFSQYNILEPFTNPIIRLIKNMEKEAEKLKGKLE